MVNESVAAPTSGDDFDGVKLARRLSTEPGVYLFRDARGKLLYVGKARNLRKRVRSYFERQHDDRRLQRMVSQIRRIDTQLVRTESEALLLENEWIKTLRPRFNIRLRDDKSYPWIHLSSGHDYPRASFYRGARNRGGEYFGPYPSASATRETLNLIYRAFRIRSCRDSVFEHRSRPCLQYQIKRCSAPCVGYISRSDYARDLHAARLLLAGKSSRLRAQLTERMQQASADLQFEQAAQLRDQLQTLSRAESQQFVMADAGDMDYIALRREHGVTVVQLMTVRGGRNLGSQSFFPDNTEQRSDAEIMAAVLGQYYHVRKPPAEIILSQLPDEDTLWRQVLSERAGRKVRLVANPRSSRAQWLKQLLHNAEETLRLRLTEQSDVTDRLQDLARQLQLESVPQRIECFDISHSSGQQTVASCVVYDHSGLNRSEYRRFNITGIQPGDDYAAMRQVLTRRYRRLRDAGAVLPDLIVVDGGQGQLTQALEVLADLELQHLLVLGVAKGRSRRAGFERWILPPPQAVIKPKPDSSAAHLLQLIRDEAHRFAITGHRQARAKASKASTLERIPGIGSARRRELLNHFGGLQELRNAGVEELLKVPGISRQLAARIVDALQG